MKPKPLPQIGQTDSELITDEQAAELVRHVIPAATEKPPTDQTAFALMTLIGWLMDCDPDMRDTNADTIEQAIFARTKAFGSAMDAFSKTGSLAKLAKAA